MARRLTDGLIKSLRPPATGNRIEYDSEVKGFGARVTAAGTRAFILNYRTRRGRERRYTIGSFPDWQAAAARKEAAELKKLIDRGGDPLEDLEKERGAPTVADLCKRYEAEHLPKKGERSGADDLKMIASYILPALKHRKVAEVTFSDIDALHRSISTRTKKREAGAPYRANRVVALLSKMFGLAIRWGWRADNPAKGIERNQEVKRHRYLAGTELERLTRALAEHPDQQAANIIRLLLLTGARSGEVRAAKWEDFDLTAGVWVKPGATTKQRTEHRVPLSAPARQLLADRFAERRKNQDYVFPGRSGEHRRDIRRTWREVCAAAEISSARIHDLRHTYASILASANISLPTIGALLGHTQTQTTHRYSHLFDDPLRAATERVGAIVSGKAKGEVVSLKGGAA